MKIRHKGQSEQRQRHKGQSEQDRDTRDSQNKTETQGTVRTRQRHKRQSEQDRDTRDSQNRFGEVYLPLDGLQVLAPFVSIAICNLESEKRSWAYHHEEDILTFLEYVSSLCVSSRTSNLSLSSSLCSLTFSASAAANYLMVTGQTAHSLNISLRHTPLQVSYRLKFMHRISY